MKQFLKFHFDPILCHQQLDEFRYLMQSREFLSEFDDILPFFKQRHQLSALVGSYHAKIIRPDIIAFEYDIFGDLKIDLVVGYSVTNAYCFIEFEDATANSIFVSKAGKSTPEWSPRFERGFNQIVDWFWKLNDFEKTDDFENRFNSRSIDYTGLLIIGRNEHLERREKKRLQWRQKNLVVNYRHITCITFDELYQTLLRRLVQYQFVSQEDN